MSIKTIDVVDNGLTKSPYEDSFFAFLPDYANSTCWAKACMISENTAEIMQGIVSCKDYLLDTQWRGQTGYKTTAWTPVQQRQNCFFLYIPQDVKFRERVASFLHPYEEANGLNKTEIYGINKITPQSENTGYAADNGYIIRGDDRWNSNGLVWSFYLSIVRALISAKSAVTLSGIFSSCSSNECSYWNNLTETGRQWIMHIYENLPLYLAPITKPAFHKYTGYTSSVGHGATGPFYLANKINLMATYLDKYKKFGLPYPEGEDFQHFIHIYQTELTK